MFPSASPENWSEALTIKKYYFTISVYLSPPARRTLEFESPAANASGSSDETGHEYSW
jgi:hypothetical protein